MIPKGVNFEGDLEFTITTYIFCRSMQKYSLSCVSVLNFVQHSVCRLGD